MSDGPHGFPWRTTAVAAVVIAVALVVVGVLVGRDPVGAPPAPSAGASGARTSTPSASASTAPLDAQRQITVLLTVRDDQHKAVTSVLIGFGGNTGRIVELVLPRDLLLPTVPPQRLEDADDPTGPRSAQQPLETLLGVRIDAVFDLERLAWSGLIDATGRRVDPASAVQPNGIILALDDVLGALPYDNETAGQVLTGLGSMARTTVTNEDAGYVLAHLGRSILVQPVTRTVLPVTYLRSGPEQVAVASTTDVDAIARDLFAGALLEPGHAGPLRVVLQRAGGTLGAQVAGRLRLMDAGYGVVVDQTMAEPVAHTTVLVPGTSAEAHAAGREVAAALGLPETSVKVDTDPTAAVDARVLLGPDSTVSPR